MTQEAAARKDTQKLQRAIVDGLEDVKAHDIQVFNTEHLSPLFERVIVASGTSNRQTKALASSVRDSVRDAGFPKPRVEGEDNGEWIIVDCGPAVAHIMQPAIRQYYHLEEIWGDKPVRLKFGAPKPAQPQHAEPAAARKTVSGKAPAKKTAGSTGSAAKATAKRASPGAQTRTGAKKTTAKAPAKRAPVRKAAGAHKTAAKSPRRKG
jgi:ribosome-associated protein